MPLATLALGAEGAIVELLVGVNVPRLKNLQRNNMPVPSRQRIPVQIDTGAETTAIDASVLALLGVGPTEILPMLTPSPTGGTQTFRRFPVSLALARGDFEMLLSSVEVTECVFEPNESIRGLLGRDVLQHCFLFYDGPKGSFSFAY